MNHVRPSASSPTSAQAAYDALVKELREIGLLGSVGSVIGWDERTQLPPKGAGLRADQASLLARMVHERFTSPRIGELLEEVQASDVVKQPHSDPAVNAREARRAYERSLIIISPSATGAPP